MKHSPNVCDVIMGRASYAGIHTIPMLSQKTGIPTSTLRRKLKTGDFTIPEMRLLNSKIGFSVEDTEMLLGTLIK